MKEEKRMKIITAIGNEELNNILKKNEMIDIEISDIQYQEGIFEILEENKNIDIIIINEKIIGNLKIEELLKRIIIIKNNIKIILINNSENNIKENKNIVKIINNENNYIKEILNYFNIENKKEEKNLFINLNEKENKIIKKRKIKNKKVEEKITKKNKNGKIITFIGPAGIGKTTIIAIMAKLIKNKKILMVDFNLINNNLHTIFGIKKYKNKKICDVNYKLKIKKEKIIKINNKIDLISDIKNIINKNNYENIEEIIINLKDNYEVILIDTTAEIEYQEIIKKIIKLSDIIICLSEGNLIQIKKTKKLLNEFINEKINIILNKKGKYTINKNLLNGIFNKNKIIAEIKYDENYNKIINKNINEIFITQKIKKDIKNIIKKLEI